MATGYLVIKECGNTKVGDIVSDMSYINLRTREYLDETLVNRISIPVNEFSYEELKKVIECCLMKN